MLTNTKDRAWPDYGGRGIKFLFRSFEEFLCSVGRRPSPRHTIDRIDKNENYQLRKCAMGDEARAGPKQEAPSTREEPVACPMKVYFDLGTLSDRVLNLLLRGSGEGDRPKSQLVRAIADEK